MERGGWQATVRGVIKSQQTSKIKQQIPARAEDEHGPWD